VAEGGAVVRMLSHHYVSGTIGGWQFRKLSILGAVNFVIFIAAVHHYLRALPLNFFLHRIFYALI
jgi:hypothetical protein